MYSRVMRWMKNFLNGWFPISVIHVLFFSYFLAHVLSSFLALWESEFFFIVHIQVRFMLIWASGHAFIAIKRALHFQDTLA